MRSPVYFLIFSTSFLVVPQVSSAETCRDGVDNVFTVNSFGNDNLPVTVRDVVIRVNDIYNKPSCHNNKVNIRMPGYFHIMGGQVIVPRDFDLINRRAIVRATISVGNKVICDKGAGGMFFIPNKLCRFRISTFVPPEICGVLQRKGTHTLEELWREVHFNSTQELPPSPSFLGISLLDILKGEYRIKLELTIDGERVLRLTMPSDNAPMQWGL
ncbi:unnamed protein product, partial [Mesorhabditis belari]|uniref:Uncharacterized protein n=1 Tax=Mesorhabditis belari TaxID=2138241 RepID=A0AAF3E8T3_9BILA